MATATRMNKLADDTVFHDIASAILRAVGDLRRAVDEGQAVDSQAALDLANRMEAYARSVLAGDAPAEPFRVDGF